MQKKYGKFEFLAICDTKITFNLLIYRIKTKLHNKEFFILETAKIMDNRIILSTTRNNYKCHRFNIIENNENILYLLEVKILKDALVRPL